MRNRFVNLLVAFFLFIAAIAGADRIQTHKPGVTFTPFTGAVITQGIQEGGWSLYFTTVGYKSRTEGVIGKSLPDGSLKVGGVEIFDFFPTMGPFLWPEWVKDRLQARYSDKKYAAAIAITDFKGQPLLIAFLPFAAPFDSKTLASEVTESRSLALVLQRRLLDPIQEYKASSAPVLVSAVVDRPADEKRQIADLLVLSNEIEKVMYIKPENETLETLFKETVVPGGGRETEVLGRVARARARKDHINSDAYHYVVVDFDSIEINGSNATAKTSETSRWAWDSAIVLPFEQTLAEHLYDLEKINGKWRIKSEKY